MKDRRFQFGNRRGPGICSWGFLIVLSIGSLVAAEPVEPIPSLYREKGLFEGALSLTRSDPPQNRKVTGITVPHHLLAIDLIALGFHSASGGSYERILLLSPDHFRKTRRPFATTDRGFETVFGSVPTDSKAVETLIRRGDLVEKSDLFDREHGIQAILPFIARYFPKVEVLPIVIGSDGTPEDWRRLVDALKPLLTRRTLIVQSTDFSHYLPEAVANRRDQETLNVIAGGSLEQLSQLQQPQHLDALAAQWIHQAIQDEVFGAEPTILAHQNSNHYTSSPQRETTSYIVQAFEKRAADRPPWPPRKGDSLFFFAGDTFLGRNFAPRASNPDLASKIQGRIARLTGGAPLILNLEGVLSEKLPVDENKNLLLMPQELTLDWLKKLNVVGVSLANNHANDLGNDGIDETRRSLGKHGIVVLGDHETHDFGPFRLAAFTDLSNQSPPHTERLTRNSVLSSLEEKQNHPLICFPHWGTEWKGAPGKRENQITDYFVEGGASIIVGAHPHTSSKGIEALHGGRAARVYSMGNFLFDQRSPRASGALVEARFFSTGTFALRWIPIENFFETDPP